MCVLYMLIKGLKNLVDSGIRIVKVGVEIVYAKSLRKCPCDNRLHVTILAFLSELIYLGHLVAYFDLRQTVLGLKCLETSRLSI